MLYDRNQGSHTTWKTLQTWHFIIYFSRPEENMEFAQKVENLEF